MILESFVFLDRDKHIVCVYKYEPRRLKYKHTSYVIPKKDAIYSLRIIRVTDIVTNAIDGSKICLDFIQSPLSCFTSLSLSRTHSFSLFYRREIFAPKIHDRRDDVEEVVKWPTRIAWLPCCHQVMPSPSADDYRFYRGNGIDSTLLIWISSIDDFCRLRSRSHFLSTMNFPSVTTSTIVGLLDFQAILNVAPYSLTQYQ